MSKTINQLAGTPRTSNTGKWMALVAAILGWLFDGFEMGMFPLVGPPALKQLLGSESGTDANQWFGAIIAVFLVGAATGGVVFGWLGDRIGRVRAMSLSIFTYAVFTGLCGFATEAWHIAVLRFVASLGMGGEWSLGVALVNELWPDKSRTMIAGLIGAASNVGFLLVGLLSLVLQNVIGSTKSMLGNWGMSEKTISYLLDHDAWRLLMIAGALPALLIFFIRLFVPESERWEDERDKGATSHWATRDLLGVLAGCVGAGFVVFLWTPPFENFAKSLSIAPILLQGPGTLLGVTIALFGYMYPVRCYLRRAQEAGDLTREAQATNIRRLFFGAALTGVALVGTWAALQWAPKWSLQLEPAEGYTEWKKVAKEYTQIASSSGAIVGTLIAAAMAGYLGRRITYTLLCIGSFASALVLYQGNDAFGPKFLASVFLAGGVTAAFYGFFPLYLPELFPTKVRATSQGFAFNFGRIIAAIGTVQTATLTKLFDGSFPDAGSALAVIYLLGVFIIWLGPETKGKLLPE
jgi:MFS transporter, SHS family, sialic acid transporter